MSKIKIKSLPEVEGVTEDSRHENMGRFLFDAARRFEKRIIELIELQGYEDIRTTHLTVVRNLDFKGTRITDLARRASITKQSMSNLVLQCENKGLVGGKADKSDGRAKAIVFTAKGRRLVKDIRVAVATVEEEIASKIGSENLQGIQTALRKYLYE